MTADGERKTVRTYIPPTQHQAWHNHASDLDMSMSEFVRAMVQAGRRDFSHEDISSENADKSTSPPTTPGVEPLNNRVLDVLDTEGPLDWEELLEKLTGDIEDRLEETLTDLQEENYIRYSGKDNGYKVIQDGR